ncbi:MAG: arylesterase [Planctomycetes bacterium]|nr:arylesterase [Planctomycetota bacterium]MCB9909811.1 arylesterase [Planctomycetota bacterium]MCB9912280.1 arylesterase [Planctomycetota bacterium]HPF12922.1 arylesterase [Planctomycetota bacterium]
MNRNLFSWRVLSAQALCSLLLVACNGSAEPDSKARLGDAWSGQAQDVEREPLAIPADAPLVIFLGDSISAGLHLNADQAFPAVLQRRLFERKLPFRLVNAGVSGDTTAGGLRRIDWLLQQKPQVVVVELGANDGLRGIELAAIESNLRQILERIRAAGATPILCAMHVPPSYGEPYSTAFHELYGRVAKDLAVPIVPSFLQGVGGMPAYNLEDGMHPNVRGHELLANNVEATLSKVLAGD